MRTKSQSGCLYNVQRRSIPTIYLQMFIAICLEMRISEWTKESMAVMIYLQVKILTHK